MERPVCPLALSRMQPAPVSGKNAHAGISHQLSIASGQHQPRPAMNRESLEVVVLNDYASLTGGSTAVALASAVGLAARDLVVTFFAAVGPVAPQLIGLPNLKVTCLRQ